MTLELVARFWAVGCGGKNLGSGFGHQDSVFKLSREAAVAGSNRPVVAGIEFRKACTGIDHRFDGKAHAGQ